MPGAGLEPARLAAADFESAASAISPPGRTNLRRETDLADPNNSG